MAAVRPRLGKELWLPDGSPSTLVRLQQRWSDYAAVARQRARADRHRAAGGIRIFGMVNHIAHQYEMLKLAERWPVSFTYLIGRRRWEQRVRPMPHHLSWVWRYEPGAYDLAILHLDQRAAHPGTATHRAYLRVRGMVRDIPRITVNHGTPLFSEPVLGEMPEEVVIRRVKQLVGDDLMIVNSEAAARRWGWGHPLRHGMSPEEWRPLPKRPLVVAQVSRGMPRYHGIPLLDAITTELGRRGIGVINIGADVTPRTWSDQRRLLGTALIYLNTTFDSPMPRGRTEAMLSGCCVLTTPRHDADSFVENGVSGYLLGDEPQEWCNLVDDLLGPRFDEAVRIGRRAREVATRAFHIDGYLAALWEIVAARAARRRELGE